jgi:hypothetical protein
MRANPGRSRHITAATVPAPGAENSVDDACHSGTQPSHAGGNGARPSDAAAEATERDAMGRFAPANLGNPFARLMGDFS